MSVNNGRKRRPIFFEFQRSIVLFLESYLQTTQTNSIVLYKARDPCVNIKPGASFKFQQSFTIKSLQVKIKIH